MSYPKAVIDMLKEQIRAKNINSAPIVEQVDPPTPVAKAPFDPALSDHVLNTLFYYFQQRGHEMAIVKLSDDGHKWPRALDTADGDDPGVTIVRSLKTLDEIREMGPDYMREFLEVTQMLLLDH